MNKEETLLLVGHGSKLPYSKQLILEIAEKVKAKNEFENVEIGMMEFNEPTIPDALKKIIASGSKKIIVVPVFLAHGTHTTKDIPTILGLRKSEPDNGHGCAHEHHEKASEITTLKSHSSKGSHDHGHAHGHGHGHHHHRHVTEIVEIPDDVEIIYREPIGVDDRIVDIVMERALMDE